MTLDRAANDLARHFQGRTATLERELAEIQTKKAALEAELQTAKRAHERLGTYRSQIGSNYQCPRCWIESEAQSALIAQPSGSERDAFLCRKCRSTYEF